jgi:hypothetical protein
MVLIYVLGGRNGRGYMILAHRLPDPKVAYKNIENYSKKEGTGIKHTDSLFPRT